MATLITQDARFNNPPPKKTKKQNKQNKANLRDLIAATGLVISNRIQINYFSARVTEI